MLFLAHNVKQSHIYYVSSTFLLCSEREIELAHQLCLCSVHTLSTRHDGVKARPVIGYFGAENYYFAVLDGVRDRPAPYLRGRGRVVMVVVLVRPGHIYHLPLLP